MRTILNISLPSDMALEIKRSVRRDGYASTSEFMRMIVREYYRSNLAKELKKQSRSFDTTSWKRITSAKDIG